MDENNKGFTLIEVLIAMVIMMVGMLALLNTAAVIIQNNMTNILRDEAVGVAEEQMNILKNTPFDSVISSTPPPIQRSFRGISKDFTVKTTVTPAGTAGDTKSVVVTVSWQYKSNPFQHSISTVMNR